MGDRLTARQEEGPTPWQEVCVEQQREEMVLEALAGRRSKSEVARHYGVTRKTVYKWMERFCTHGREGLSDLLNSASLRARDRGGDR